MKFFISALLFLNIVMPTNLYAETSEKASDLTDEQMVVEIEKHLSDLEKKFEALDVEKVISTNSIKEYDEVKNDFLTYKNFLQGLTDFSKDKSLKLKHLSIADERGMKVTVYKESLGSDEFRNQLRMRKYNMQDYNPTNIVYKKFNQFLLKVEPALSGVEAKEKNEKESIVKAEEQERLKKKRELNAKYEQMQNTPECKKIKSFIYYCQMTAAVQSRQQWLKNEKELDNRSGTKNNYRTREITEQLMNYEKEIGKIKSSYSNNVKGLSLSTCKVVSMPNSNLHDLSEATKTEVTKSMKLYCDDENWY